ncbi:MAG TPA: hypothetical protein VFJ64_10775 [Solirubrobacterales bacterium]|nr:hypothetical protein [Solirubrobacterales bacterium]
MDADSKAVVWVCSLLVALIVGLGVTIGHYSNRDTEMKTKAFGACVSSGKPPLECRTGVIGL